MYSFSRYLRSIGGYQAPRQGAGIQHWTKQLCRPAEEPFRETDTKQIITRKNCLIKLGWELQREIKSAIGSEVGYTDWWGLRAGVQEGSQRKCHLSWKPKTWSMSWTDLGMGVEGVVGRPFQAENAECAQRARVAQACSGSWKKEASWGWAVGASSAPSGPET